jgi:CBS domain-containing protein
MQPEHDSYFKALAKFVSDGLDACGYFYCPGDMMATADRWRQPLSVWRGYFRKWIAKPVPEAQMLASVMFDLRPIGGDESLFADLQANTLKSAAENSIFVSHMIANSLKHTPPLGLFRGFATVRSGEHKNTIDLKHNGVVPIVDLGRIYALQAGLPVANTRARLEAAIDAGKVSATGGRDLLDAYDMIAETRLEHQAAQIRRGEKPDNFMPPTDLSDFERSHLRDAFVVVKTMQSAAGQGRGILS